MGLFIIVRNACGSWASQPIRSLFSILWQPISMGVNCGPAWGRFCDASLSVLFSEGWGPYQVRRAISEVLRILSEEGLRDQFLSLAALTIRMKSAFCVTINRCLPRTDRLASRVVERYHMQKLRDHPEAQQEYDRRSIATRSCTSGGLCNRRYLRALY